MIATIHQPNFLPWLGYFYKMAKADVFVFADTLGLSRGSYTQRVRIKTQPGPRWLTLPLLHTGRVSQPIRQIRCGGWTNWQERIMDSLKGNYLHCKHYQPYAEQIKGIITSGEDNLARFNIRLVKLISRQLGINTRTLCSSDMRVKVRAEARDQPDVRKGRIQIKRTATDWIIAVCKEAGADTFLSGLGGAEYQDEEAYARAGIRLVYSDFKHPTYPQAFGDFEPGLSIVDLLFNCGPSSRLILGA